MKTHFRPVCAALAAFAALALTACASTPPPTAEMAVSTAAVGRAVSAGATELSAMDLRNARDKLEQANVALAARDHERARRLALEAQVDAQLAQAKAESSKAGKAAAELQESTRVLRLELDRKTP